MIKITQTNYSPIKNNRSLQPTSTHLAIKCQYLNFESINVSPNQLITKLCEYVKYLITHFNRMYTTAAGLGVSWEWEDVPRTLQNVYQDGPSCGVFALNVRCSTHIYY